MSRRVLRPTSNFTSKREAVMRGTVFPRPTKASIIKATTNINISRIARFMPSQCSFWTHGLYYSFSNYHGLVENDVVFEKVTTVDGWNPAPPGMYQKLVNNGKTTYQLVQDFFHQQYHWINTHFFTEPWSKGRKSALPETNMVPENGCFFI